MNEKSELYDVCKFIAKINMTDDPFLVNVSFRGLSEIFNINLCFQSKIGLFETVVGLHTITEVKTISRITSRL